MNVRDLVFDHLFRLTDDLGLFEHAEFTQPRKSHGYCTDDAARALVVVVREPGAPSHLQPLLDRYLQFLTRAQSDGGRIRNRLGVDGRWVDEPRAHDPWGRAVWAFGTAARRATPRAAAVALEYFERSATVRSRWSRSMAFAGLGAAEVLRRDSGNHTAGQLLEDAVTTIGRPASDPVWRWPEPRLTYANAALPEVLIAAGAILGDASALDDGLTLLRWLLNQETRNGHLSPTPVGGWALGEPRPGFDQQPIEVAALADACTTAFEVTGDDCWREAVQLAEAWFFGVNDSGVVLVDTVSGGGFDGLQRWGRNENQGAESTLAMLSTLQQARRFHQR